MPNLEEVLLNRLVVPEGPANPDQLPPAQPSISGMGRDLFEGGIDTLLGMIGAGPETKANQFGQLVGAAGPMFKVGNRVLKKVGDSWQWLDEAQTTTQLNKLKKFEPIQKVAEKDELGSIVAQKPERTVPKLSGVWGTKTKPSVSMSQSKLNPSMVQDIRKRLAAGEMMEDIAKDYGVKDTVIYAIKRNDAWNWVK